MGYLGHEFFMMWNETLNKLDKTHTPILAAQKWGQKIQHIHLVNEGINLVYCYELHQQKYYLRLTHAKLRSPKELEAALMYQRHLFEHDAPVCEPMLSQNGLWFESVWQGDEEFLAHVCKEVPGEPIHSDYPALLYETWGQALGQLHAATASYDFSRYQYATWSKSIEEMEAYITHESLEIKNALDSVSTCMNARPQSNQNYGLTHGDHREGNVLTDGKQLHLIDFDLPSINWFTEDLFRPFFDAIVHNRTNWQDKMKPYLEGYFSIRHESSADLSAFPWQILMKCLEIYLWTKNNWNGESAPGGENNQNWLQVIHHKIIDREWMISLPHLIRN